LKEAPQLTARQREIVKLIAAGLSDKEIAQRLGLETQSVKNTLQRIYRDTGTHSRVELIRSFFELVEKTA
jgi:DNA-binding NarL/FixJ family response regulator